GRLHTIAAGSLRGFAPTPSNRPTPCQDALGRRADPGLPTAVYFENGKRRHLDQGHDTGTMLESGLRAVFRIFRDGLACSELSIAPLGGALFGTDTTPTLDRLAWGEKAVAILLDRLLWRAAQTGERARVHYGALGVEDLGSIYETMLELEPGIADVP